jgi:hypothetical protein
MHMVRRQWEGGLIFKKGKPCDLNNKNALQPISLSTEVGLGVCVDFLTSWESSNEFSRQI